MNNEKYNRIIDDAYDNYCRSFENQSIIEQHSFGTEPITKVIFVEKIKNLDWFSETWGLRIEERELSDEESVFHYEKELYSPLRIFDQKIPTVPTKLITIIYNNETIEVYEN